MSVPSSSTAEDVLDDLAARVFGSAEGRARLEPLLERWAAEVGTILDDDDEAALWQAVRTDWALLDVTPPGARGPGDTWAMRAIRGEVPGVEVPKTWAWVVGTWVGLFEVWPGPRPWLRDRLRGLSVALHDPVHLEPAQPGRPAALWEVRLRLDDGRARLCRMPVAYPLEIAPLLERASQSRWQRGGASPSLQGLRRACLHWRRAPRVDPRAIFRFP